MGLSFSRLTPSSYTVTFSYTVAGEPLIGLDIQDITVVGADIENVEVSSNLNWTTQSSSNSASLINFSGVYFDGVPVGDSVEITLNIDLSEPVKTFFVYFGNSRVNDSLTLDQALVGSVGESLSPGTQVLDTSIFDFSPTQLYGPNSSSFSLDPQNGGLSIDASIANESINEFSFAVADGGSNSVDVSILNIDGNDAPTTEAVTLSAIAEDSGA